MLLTPDRVDFLNKCRKIVKLMGQYGDVCASAYDAVGYSYEDELVYIAESEDELYFEVERKRIQSPVVYIRNGAVIMFHSDFYFLTQHIDELYKKIKNV